MKKTILAATTSLLLLGSAMASANDGKADDKLVFEIDGSTPMTATEISDTRGEAVLKAGLKCKWKVICKPYIYTAYERVTGYDRNGRRYTYTRNH